MPALFFALAAASSGTSETSADRLALLQGSDGWRSGRCCSYPQELLLELEKPAEIQEIEASTIAEFAPSAVEVHVSKNSDGESCFQHVGTLRFDRSESSSSMGIRRAQMRLYESCSGQVRIIVHKPLHSGSSNLYEQTSLSSIELWGVEHSCFGAVSGRKPAFVKADVDASMLPGDNGDVARVLTDLGIPLNVVPLGSDSQFSGVDEISRKLLIELQTRRDNLSRSGEFGAVQSLTSHMEHLQELGVELRSLLSQRDGLIAVNSLQDAQSITKRIRDLERRRLDIAAIYETEFWIQHLSVS